VAFSPGAGSKLAAAADVLILVAGYGGRDLAQLGCFFSSRRW